MSARSKPAVALLAVTLLSSAVADGHIAPAVRENNVYVTLVPFRDRVRLVYTVFLGEIPGQRTRAKIDANGDGSVDETEAEHFGSQVAAALSAGLELSVDGRELRAQWVQVRAELDDRDVSSGAFAVHLLAWLCLENPRDRREHIVRFSDRTPFPPAGEAELRVERSPGVVIQSSTLTDSAGRPVGVALADSGAEDASAGGEMSSTPGIQWQMSETGTTVYELRFEAGRALFANTGDCSPPGTADEEPPASPIAASPSTAPEGDEVSDAGDEGDAGEVVLDRRSHSATTGRTIVLGVASAVAVVLLIVAGVRTRRRK